MSLRWRLDGPLLCAAKTQPEDGDTYIDDRLHYQLSVVSRAILPSVDEEGSGEWLWLHPEDGSFIRAERELAASTAPCRAALEREGL